MHAPFNWSTLFICNSGCSICIINYKKIYSLNLFSTVWLLLYSLISRICAKNKPYPEPEIVDQIPEPTNNMLSIDIMKDIVTAQLNFNLSHEWISIGWPTTSPQTTTETSKALPCNQRSWFCFASDAVATVNTSCSILVLMEATSSLTALHVLVTPHTSPASAVRIIFNIFFIKSTYHNLY